MECHAQQNIGLSDRAILESYAVRLRLETDELEFFQPFGGVPAKLPLRIA